MTFRIPSRADITPILTRDDRVSMLHRALRTCPDGLADLEAIIAHLHHLGITLSSVSDILDAAIDEARACRLTEGVGQ